MQKRLKEIKPGEVFKFGGYEWIKLGQEGLALTKEVVVNKIFDDKSNNFNLSSIKEYINITFRQGLITKGVKGNDIRPINLDLTADDGTKYGTSSTTMLIGLLTADLYRKNRHLLEPINSDWWLATPKSCYSDYTDSALFVDSDGIIWDEYTNDLRGVRPLCKLSLDTLVEVSEEDKPTENTDITELIKKWAIENKLDKEEENELLTFLLPSLCKLLNNTYSKTKEEIGGAIGGVFVALTTLSLKHGIDINGCIKAAYEKIKNRKGKLVNGLFVEEGDLE